MSDLGWQGGDIDAATTLGPNGADPSPAWETYLGRTLEEFEPPASPWNDIEPPTLNYRTLADISDEPPRPLLLGMLEPDGPTMAYAAPGVGKGMSCAWLITELQRFGLKVLIYDAERREREWARRVAGLGGDRSAVVYLVPENLGPRLAGRPLWESAHCLGHIVKESGADLLIVDSVLPAIGIGEERLRSDAQAPYLFVQALDALGKPSLSLGHPPKGQPEGDPFGSMAWVAAMRMTWIGTRAEGDPHRVRWRPRKRNGRGQVAGFLLSFDYGTDGRPVAASRQDDEQDTRDRVLLMLKDRPRSVADLAAELLEDEDHVTADRRDRVKEMLSKSLRRMARDGIVIRQGPATGRNVRWALQWDP